MENIPEPLLPPNEVIEALNSKILLLESELGEARVGEAKYELQLRLEKAKSRAGEEQLMKDYVDALEAALAKDLQAKKQIQFLETELTEARIRESKLEGQVGVEKAKAKGFEELLANFLAEMSTRAKTFNANLRPLSRGR
jgi:predicted  nucleic acid-binding Zn-ribbon protein